MRLIWVVTFGLMLTANNALFAHLLKYFPWRFEHAGFLISVTIFFTLITALWLMLICHGRATRWLLALIVLASAFTGYYMDEFGVIIDTVMLDNALKTDSKEVAGLLTWSFAIRMLLLGLLPAILLIWKTSTHSLGVDSIVVRLKHMGWLCLGIVLVVVPFKAEYTEFVREHKIVRMYANPTFYNYSLIKWGAGKLFSSKVSGLSKVATEKINVAPSAYPKLMIMVVGETARFDRFALNGYHKPTNPRLSNEQVVSLQNVTSCGTSTGVSVPCMFSMLTRKQYNEEKALHMQNALDVLSERGVKVLWRDNNSDSKGVALRVPYEDFKSPSQNSVCEANECRDIGMLAGLDQFVSKSKGHDVLIVLHQMGNHGPEYYRRYPDEFKQFMPICMTGRLSECSQQEVDNAYDNAILYTDYFLSEVIQFLKKYDAQRETAMLYVSDHGESLGEQGIYLHAAPYLVAPKEQTHVPAIVWFGRHFKYQVAQIQPYADYPLSHDDVFCSLLTAYQFKSSACHSDYHWLINTRALKAQPAQ
ncbi:phosphoethanolamine transferase [Methylophilus sp. 5]|uniref:phosphoethanolamine transferase n=1 Tax=Methylophilus sp. 5 TaxID=1112274 RepID=UPI001E4AFA7B|nr:phosphoethanolamine--lipid A transferase [Methylophilus sp. 5]